MKKKSTLINEYARKRLGVTRDEYALCAYIHYRCSDPRNKRDGWCDDGKEEIAEFIGISRRGLLKMRQRLENESLIEIGAKGWFRATAKWIDADNDKREQSSQSEETEMGTKFPQNGNKVPTKREQSSQDNGNKVPKVNKGDNKGDKVNEGDIIVGKKKPTLKTSASKPKKEKAPPISAPPPPAAERKPNLPFQMREIFEVHYRRIFNDEIFDWQAKEMKALKELGKKLRARLEAKSLPIEDENILKSWDQFLKMAAECDAWTVENGFTPARLNGSYQALIQKMIAHNGKAKTNINERGKTTISAATRLERALETGRKIADEIAAGTL